LIGVLSIHLRLPGCASLKEKRGRLKPLLTRLHKEFDVSAAEMELQDKWQETIIACGMVGNDRVHLEQALQAVAYWVEGNWPDMQVMNENLELI
jgi:uncharacterized protein YlxP (DUF503 family)